MKKTPKPKNPHPFDPSAEGYINPNSKEHLKGDMLILLEKHKGIVSAAARQLGINRDTHYEWMKRDAEYKKAVEEVLLSTADYVESQLFKLIRDKNPAAVMFYLRTKGKKSGYGEEIKVDGKLDITWNEEKTYEAD